MDTDGFAYQFIADHPEYMARITLGIGRVGFIDGHGNLMAASSYSAMYSAATDQWDVWFNPPLLCDPGCYDYDDEDNGVERKGFLTCRYVRGARGSWIKCNLVN
jgi:hypothetical protein